MGLIKLTLLIVGLDNITRKIKLTLLTMVEGNIPEMIWTNFETNKLRTQQVTEFHVKKNTKFDVKNEGFSPIWGARMGLIKLTLLIVGLDNITRKLLTNFETNKFRTQRVTEFHVKKYKFFSFFGGKGGSDQTDTANRRVR